MDTGIKTLYPGEGTVHVDVVFVHGLGGHRERTWTDDATGKCWPRDFLKDEPNFKAARIMTWGYDTSFLSKTPKNANSIFGHADNFLNDLDDERQDTGTTNRPIILVGHSMGGLLIKEAMIKAERYAGQRNQADLAALYENTKGIVFLGTPHTGTNAADLGHMVANMAKIALRKSNKKLVDMLAKDSPILENSRSAFVSIADKFRIASAWEACETKIGKIVPQDSSIMGIGSERTVSIEADHEGMVKFSDSEDQGYKRVRHLLQWVYRQTIQVRNAQLLKSLSFGGMDFREQNLTAHEETFKWLLDPEQNTGGSSHLLEWLRGEIEDPIFWLNGKAGSGKSTLMKVLHSDPLLRHHLQCWAASKDLIVAGFYFFEQSKISPLQKSSEGLLRALLYQLFSQREDLIPSALSTELRYYEWDAASDARPVWTWKRLQKAFEALLEHKPTNLAVYLFVDGLDEYHSCDTMRSTYGFEDDTEDSSERILAYREIADFFVNVSKHQAVKLCLSSRHSINEFVTRFSGRPMLKLENITHRDIEAYINGRLQDFQSENQNLVHGLTNTILEKASGVFLWVQIVVNKLLAARSAGDTDEELVELIHSLPTQLGGPNGLYMCLLRKIDPQYLHQAYSWFRCVRDATARRPSLFQLSLTDAKLETALDPSVKPLTDKDVEKRVQSLELRLRSRCGGLLEIAHEKPGDPLFIYPQFIHKTVEEFLHKKYAWQLFAESTGHLDETDVNLSLLQAYVLQLKYIQWTSPFDGYLWDLIEAAFGSAMKSQVSSAKPTALFINELDRAASAIFRQLCTGYDHRACTSKEEERFLPGQHWWMLHPHPIFPSYLKDFAQVAVHQGLYVYFDEKLSVSGSQTIAAASANNDPLLAYLLDTGPDLDAATVETAITLLAHGANPNESFGPLTVWELSLSVFFDAFCSSTALFSKFVQAFLEAGADVNATVFQSDADFRKLKLESFLYCVVTRTYVSHNEEYRKDDRMALAKTLRQRGAYLFYGEKERLRETDFCNEDEDWPEREVFIDEDDVEEAWGIVEDRVKFSSLN